jgi:hypothetical protein
MTRLYEGLIPVLGISEVEEQRELAVQTAIAACSKVAYLQFVVNEKERARLTREAIARECKVYAQLEALQRESGFIPGEDIWLQYGKRRLKAVYWGKIGSKAGIALLKANDSWLPAMVDFGQISARFDLVDGRVYRK